MKFKIGDKVKYTSDAHGDGHGNPLWGGRLGKVEGEITRSDHGHDYCYGVSWDNGNHNSYMIDDLELIFNSVPKELFEI